MFIKKEKGKITGLATAIPEIYDEKKKKFIPDPDYEKIDENSKELQDFRDRINKTGKYKEAEKPNYDIEKQWEILEEEIPKLKKYRKTVRGE